MGLLGVDLVLDLVLDRAVVVGGVNDDADIDDVGERSDEGDGDEILRLDIIF